MEKGKRTTTTKLKGSVAAGILVGAMTVSIDGQDPVAQPSPTVEPTIKLSKLLAANIASAPAGTPISQQDAARAYAKLLEGERYLWRIKNARGRRNPSAVFQQNLRNARLAFQDSINANPRLAEAYTALAELAITAPPSDVDEAIELANLALKIDKNNFGARRILARLYTFKSGLGSRSLDSTHSSKAVDHWKFVASLDPRYAEAWAFLAEFYERQDKQPERIDALEKWRSSAAAIDSQFYQRMTGGRANLSPEAATIKLAEALAKNGKATQAIDILSQIIADDPDNAAAIDLLGDAIAESKATDLEKAISALRQAVYANPDSLPLLKLLSEAYVRSGQVSEAAQTLEGAALRLAETDRSKAALQFVALGEMLERSGKYAEAGVAYEKAIRMRGLQMGDTLSDDERILIGETLERLISVAKAEGKLEKIPAIIERSRAYFGPEDPFADRQLIAYYRETGKRLDALKLVQSQRSRMPNDEGWARQEATLLTELGRVDEAVGGYRKFVAARSSAEDAAVDTFSSLLFITNLYAQANRGKEAVEAANQALAAARGAERRQIARLSIATALQNSGDFDGAESTLRDILKESPNNPIALNNLGYFLLERGQRFGEALELIRKAVDTDPTNPSYLDSLGWAYFKIGKLAEAELYLREALRHDSSSVTINEHLGDVYAAQSKKEQAKSYWQKALTLASEDSDASRLKQKLGTK
ncbi:MAG TPA: tetratricopeptide repeat protein [Pyrinomonadaceae bacterium]